MHVEWKWKVLAPLYWGLGETHCVIVCAPLYITCLIDSTLNYK